MVTKNGIRTFSRYVAEEVRADNICVVTFSPRYAIATEDASDEAKRRMPAPDVLEQAFVLVSELGMEYSGKCVAYEDQTIVLEKPMEG
jgi:diaminopimelate epimerase